ncbi:MAG: GNAT family N-acetyltransferase [Hamadaea sp.]|nr:GNAT family N-acetyltransferase [Hamadaea sp.]NUR51735.1 GNAT family N-acetyltransferase [Hamadaea sp.]NUT02784.1 GNAT family N-acetyltransferase [Hamadaea sp.]
MIEIRRTTLDDWQTWKALRLNALRLAPTAYGETYANAAGADDHYWHRWWLERGDDAVRSIGYLDGVPAGQIACAEVPEFTEPLILAMWVEEDMRGTGIAGALVTDTLDWARAKGFPRIRLGVTEGNETARKLYLRHGFTSLGEFEPLHSHPDLRIEWMARDL